MRATAMGLSFNQAAELLDLILGTRAARTRSTVHRWVQAAATTAGKVLQRLDGLCTGLVKTACLDETFFHRSPILVGVEPNSRLRFLVVKADRLDRAAWLKNLAGWDALDYVVCDAGTVLQSALSVLAKQRRTAGLRGR